MAEKNRVLLIEAQKSQNQSGKAHEGNWTLCFINADHKIKDETLGWISTTSTHYQVHLKFSSLEDAQNYIKDNKLILIQIVHAPMVKKTIQSYADRFK